MNIPKTSFNDEVNFYVYLQDKDRLINEKKDVGYILVRVTEVAQSNLYRVTMRYAHIDMAD